MPCIPYKRASAQSDSSVFQFFGGAIQTTGWPSVVTIVANWFGKGKKGLIFGLWNSHTSIGNILGSFIAGENLKKSKPN